MNKTQLIDALAERLGDRKIAAAAVAGVVDVVIRAVTAGDKVTITGFGVFEKRARAARMARNPRTGESVETKGTEVPVFRPGTLFREVVSGARTSTNDMARARPATATARPAAGAASGRPDGTASVVSLTPSAKATAPDAAAGRLAEVTVANSDTKAAIKAAKAAAKAAKAAKKKESKNATKPPAKSPTAKAPTKVTGKKAVKKSVTKK